MPIYITQGRYTRDAIKGMIVKPEDRADAVARLLSKAGGKSPSFRTVGPLAVSFFIAKEADSPEAVHAHVAGLVDELAPRLLEHADESSVQEALRVLRGGRR